jgi:undecaprenyl pyrophosphate phosphatase UppP
MPVDFEGRKMAMTGRGTRITGIVAIVIAALAAIFALLNFVSHHPQRAIAAFVGCVVFLILGIVLIAMTARKSKK